MRMLWAIASLTCVWSLCNPIGAQPKDAAAPLPVWRQPIEGSGETEEIAKKFAVKNAKEIVDALRASMNPLVKTSDLSEDEIRKRFLVDAGKEGDELVVQVNGGEFMMKKWIVTLKPETERMLRSDERETISYLAMIGLSIVLVAGFGYIRLDEYTQRKYTTWLRLAGVGVVASALVCWWTIR